ncbi:hypothetical protein [Halococcus saccharolyticus]|uniref:hypothetical protein n=1 Tax=Halococcus saccharolyticus TaxID=62319 RepID=UPI00126701BF|nr:hypothetical protein [Halococcus saccharolyticus]
MEWKEIERRYHNYHQRYPSDSRLEIRIGDQESVDYPLKWGITNGVSSVFDSNEFPTDNVLLSFDNSVEDIGELSPKKLLKLAIPLTRVGQAKITEDHREYWRESYRQVRPRGSEGTQYFDQMVKMSTVLSCIMSAPEEESFLGANSHLLANYLVYASLEAFLKEISREDICFDGRLKPEGRIRRLSQGEEYYTYSEDEDTYVSSIGALLLHVEREVVRSSFSDILVDFRHEVAAFSEGAGPDQAYGVIQNWRNGLYHGEEKPLGQFFIILNLLCLLRWEQALHTDYYYDISDNEDRK